MVEVVGKRREGVGGEEGDTLAEVLPVKVAEGVVDGVAAALGDTSLTVAVVLEVTVGEAPKVLVGMGGVGEMEAEMEEVFAPEGLSSAGVTEPLMAEGEMDMVKDTEGEGV